MILEITVLQERWLKALGDRNATHVIKDGNGKLFIYMKLAGEGEEKIYLPKDNEIEIPINVIK